MLMSHIKVDIEELILALESQPEFGEFFLDKASGKIVLVSEYPDDDAVLHRERLEEDPDRFLFITPLPSHVGWDIMRDFVENLENSSAHKSLERALQGRKPFRSFKDDLLKCPDTREQWFQYQTQ